MSHQEELQDLILAYAMGVIEEDEKRRLDQLMAESNDGAIEQEIAAYMTVADMIPLAGPDIEPSPNLESRLFDRLNLTPSSTSGASGAKTVAMQRQPLPTQQPVRERQRPAPVEPAIPWWQRLFAPSPALRLATGLAMLLLLVTSGLLFQNNQNLANNNQTLIADNQTLADDNQSLVDTNQELEAALESASTLETFDLVAQSDSQPSATGLIIMNASGQNGAFVVDGLTILAETSEYQLWLIDGDAITPGPVFSVNANGYSTGWIRTETPLSSFSNFGLTIEPAGGSPAPSTEILLLGDGANR